MTDNDNVIQFPTHGCAVGMHCQFRGPRGIPMTGTVISLNAHSAEIVPDTGRVSRWRVNHSFIVRLDGELPPRSEETVLLEIARCYARLERAWNPSGISPNRQRQLGGRLRQLFAELGRDVSRDEALGRALDRGVWRKNDA